MIYDIWYKHHEINIKKEKLYNNNGGFFFYIYKNDDK